jgi:hypothetical protein
MRYSIHGGTGYVAQNAAVQYVRSSNGVDKKPQSLCGNDLAICISIDPKDAIDKLEYAMVYEDKECCEDGHKFNILDKYHTHVSIGIAYDESNFAMIQNFENQYVVWDKPINNLSFDHNLSLKGRLQQGIKFNAININYDAYPTHQTYLDNLENISYDSGKFVSIVVEPAPIGSYYKTPLNYTLIEARKWDVKNTEFDISFSIDRLSEIHGNGVYTVLLFCKDKNNKDFLAAARSVFID